MALKLIASDEQQITVQLSYSDLYRIILGLHHSLGWMDEDLKTNPGTRAEMAQEMEETARLMNRLKDLADLPF